VDAYECLKRIERRQIERPHHIGQMVVVEPILVVSDEKIDENFDLDGLDS
jgi:hypothetical protein